MSLDMSMYRENEYMISYFCYEFTISNRAFPRLHKLSNYSSATCSPLNYYDKLNIYADILLTLLKVHNKTAERNLLP